MLRIARASSWIDARVFIGGKDAAGVFRRQSEGVLPWLTQRHLYQPGLDLTHSWHRARPKLKDWASVY